MEREPAVAGRFYPGDPGQLQRELQGFLSQEGAPPARAALGILSPHAGYLYSGRVAGATWARVEVPPCVILLCPNHTGRGARSSLWAEGVWHTPLGPVAVDEPLCEELLESGLATADEEAHLHEHALEVQLPFLQSRRAEATIVPLCLGHMPFESCEALGKELARAAKGRKVLIVASSDMSHYIPASVARRRDRRALDRLLALDARGLHALVEREGISMCGFVPATVMVVAAVDLGAKGAELVGYATSGDVTGDDSSVVGYAGAVIG